MGFLLVSYFYRATLIKDEDIVKNLKIEVDLFRIPDSVSTE